MTEKVRSRRRGEREKERASWLFNLCGQWERVAVIHGFVSQLIKERKFLKKTFITERYGHHTSPICKQRVLIFILARDRMSPPNTHIHLTMT